jgi:hypothetical protein
MALYHSPSISTNGLILCLDAANPKSYPGSGTTWFDLSGNGNHFTIAATAYNNSGPRYMDFNGSFGCAKYATGTDLIISGDVTVVCWTRILNSSSAWRTLLRGTSANSGSDHQVIVQSGGWLIGMYDNTNGTTFNSSGFSQQSLPGYGTSQWNMLVWRWNNSTTPYYNFSYNDSPEVIRGSNSSINSRFKHGFNSLGAYGNNAPTGPTNSSQFWGDIGSFFIYNRYLTNAELLQHFSSLKGRYGV